MTKQIELPKKKVLASSKSPKNFILFSKPKVGKTEAFAQLEDALILDIDHGSDYVDALKIKIDSVEDIINVGKQIFAENKPYKYTVIDTVTKLEEICVPYAEKLYSKKIQGKNWFKKDKNGKLDKTSGKAQYGNILNLPNGAGL